MYCYACKVILAITENLSHITKVIKVLFCTQFLDNKSDLDNKSFG